LYSAGLYVNLEEGHWVRPDLKDIILNSEELSGKLCCRIRYRQDLVGCVLRELFDIEGHVLGYQIVFDSPLKSVTPGQFVAIYLNDEIVFSGVIS
jgi:tRNA-specific 2-thiouridylase